MITGQQSLINHLQNTKSLMSVYDKKTKKFHYHADMLAYFGADLAGQELWRFLEKHGWVSAIDAEEIKSIILSLNETNSVFFKFHVFGKMGGHALSFTYADDKITVLMLREVEIEHVHRDDLTGLITRNEFCTQIANLNRENTDIHYALFFFDIIKFKAINDVYGFAEGDALLIAIARELMSGKMPIVTACRTSADRFAFLAETEQQSAEQIAEALLHSIKQYDLPMEIHSNVGVYNVPKTDESGNSMLDKAVLAQSAIKGSYTKTVSFFTEKLRDEMLSEQEIIGEMNGALGEEQFLVYYQPQYNHSTGMLVGAEALVRWMHPQKGMISPGRFIPIFEKNGFITKLDFYVFDRVARFIRRSMDHNYSIVPISVNFSKHDIFSSNFVETLEDIRKKHGVPSKYLRVEITESVLLGNGSTVDDVMDKLHACGYIVEMDDFGSGYSSLNVLKDLDFDIIKLDMLFLTNEGKTGRGGTILSSVINMAKWLKIPVIAEGVETVEQADFLRSIGCDHIQGYLYSKPLPEADYEALVNKSHIGALIPQMKLNDALNSANFWEPTSQETLIFSNFVGAAAIFNYDRKTKKMDLLRVNKKYLRELGMNLSEHDIIHKDPVDTLDGINREIYFAALERAIATGEEEECETWRKIKSDCCGEEQICIRSTVTVIGKSDDHILYYGTIRNITAEKNTFNAMTDVERRFKVVSDQVNVYFWEYTIATQEMRPCFRCMRDLGLPPLLRNYPDSAFEAGIFPPEVYDMYVDWHRQIANGVKELEAIIPLTADRIPFHVRYTTEFDENGHPIKAYGSATLVVD